MFGRGSIYNLPNVLSSLGLKGNALIVTGKRFAKQSGYLDLLITSLKNKGDRPFVFDDVEPNPSTDTVSKGAKLAMDNDINFIIAFGGGSVIDAAKAISILPLQGGSIEDYFYDLTHKSVQPPTLPVVAIPTTCGTGSEVTKYAVITKGKNKYTVLGDQIIPIAAILDGETLKLLPPDQFAIVGMDAISHAIESYFNKESNIYSEMLAVNALKILINNFIKGYDNEIEAREAMLYGSMLAGMAINMTGTTVVHALSAYITPQYNIPHGLSNSLFIDIYLKKISNALPMMTLKLAKALGFSSDNPDEAQNILFTTIVNLKRHSKIMTGLKNLNIPKTELTKIAEEGYNFKRLIEKIPVKIKFEDVLEIVNEAYIRM
ncbi:MAG: iron-containing alcohol dehydrogenase [Candidatus Methanomethylicia archaeon]